MTPRTRTTTRLPAPSAAPGGKPRRGLSPAPLALIGLLLAGCSAVGPDYQRPAVGLPAAYAEPGQADARAPGDPAWWTLFGDAVLNDLMDQALAGNYDLQAAVARMEEAEAALRETGAALVPEVDLATGASRSRSSSKAAVYNSAMPTYRSSHSLGLSTAFELDFWGRLRRAREAAAAQALASRYGRDTVRLTLAGLVANAYIALRAHDAELAVALDTQASRDASLKIVTARVDAGLAGTLDLRQAQGALAASRAQVANLRLLRGLAEHQLAVLTARPGLKIAAGDLGRLPQPPVPPPGLPTSLLDARPDLRQAEATLAASSAQVGVAKAALYPAVSLTGALGAESRQLVDLFAPGARTWSAGVGLFLPVFDAGAGEARVDQATARQRQALAAYQQAVETAFREVNDALVGLRENAEAEAAQAQRVAAEGKALELAEARYEAGYAGYLEVLDAQRSLYIARLAQIASRQSRLAAAVDLFKALGGGWREAPAP